MTLPLTDIFAHFTQGLLNLLTVVMFRRKAPQPVTFRLTVRVCRLRNRFLALLAQFRAGTLPPLRPSRAGAAVRAQPEPRPAPPAIPTPRQIDAMLRPIPESAWHCRCFLAEIVDNDLEARALVAAAPQAGRILRVFCRMLGFKPPAWLALPRRPRAPRPRARRPRPPAPRKPADASKLGRIAFANLIAPECRDGPSGFRPPNRIGYGRARRLPRDYDPGSKND